MKQLSYSLLIISFLFHINCEVFGQEKLNISTGFGLPELINIGLRYQSDQTQIGASVGSMPLGSDETIFSISGDIYYHFAGYSELSNRRPWYGRVGLTYMYDETNYVIEKYLFLNTRIGRDLNISNKIGINIDIGILFQLYNDKTRKKESSGWNIDMDIPVIPSLGIGLFYRI